MNMRRSIVVLAVVLGAAGCGGGASHHTPRVSASDSATPGTPGWQQATTLAASDVTVTVAAPSGTVIASGGPLSIGLMLTSGAPLSLSVPDEPFYTITLSGVPGSITFSRSQLEHDGWQAGVSIG